MHLVYVIYKFIIILFVNIHFFYRLHTGVEFENEVRRLKINQDTEKCNALVFEFLRSLARENKQLTDDDLDGIGDKAHEWFKALRDEIDGKEMTETEKMWFINNAKTKILSDLCKEDNCYSNQKAYKILLLLVDTFY